MTELNATPSISKARIKSAALGLKTFINVLLRELDEGELKHRAMSLVYTSLLSLAPLLAVSFSVLKAFGAHNQLEPLLRNALAPLGEKSGEISANIIQFVENIQVGVLGFVGFVMLFYTVVSLLAQIEDCFNHIWRVSKSRPLYRRFSDYLSIILVGPVLLFSAVGIAASMGNADIVQRIISQEPFGMLYYLIGVFLPYLLIISVFTFAYAFIPNTAVSLRPALAGGLAAGLTWKAAGVLFSAFVADSAQYSAIYSGFAAILVAMIWLYINWLILLCGAVIAFHVQFPHYLSYAKRHPHLSIRCQEQLNLTLMYLIGRQHIQNGAACSIKSLASAVNLPWELVTEQLELLKQHGFLMTLTDDVSYALALDSDTILLRDILCAVRTTGDQPAFSFLENKEESVIKNLLMNLEDHTAKFLQDRSLRDVIKDSEHGID